MASFIAAGTSYATRGVPMVPFYIFYSMFGFQRVGDLIWQAADARARGLPARRHRRAHHAARRGPAAPGRPQPRAGLAPCPPCQAYDPAFAYEMATIVQHGIRRMYGPNPEDVFYYLTLYNENYPMPAMPDRPGIEEGIIAGPLPVGRGARRAVEAGHHPVLGLGPGRGPPGRRRAGRALRRRRRAVVGHVVQGAARRGPRPSSAGTACTPARRPRIPLVTPAARPTSPGPIVAVTDFMKIVPEQVARFVPDRPFIPLGTDGFGRSDTREALRRFFEVDAGHVVVAVLAGLAEQGEVKPEVGRRRHRPLRHRPRGRQPGRRLTRRSPPAAAV